jgi:hypothetical protein
MTFAKSTTKSTTKSQVASRKSQVNRPAGYQLFVNDEGRIIAHDSKKKDAIRAGIFRWYRQRYWRISEGKKGAAVGAAVGPRLHFCDTWSSQSPLTQAGRVSPMNLARPFKAG